MDNVQLIQLSNYVRPEVKEEIGRKWVLNGKENSFFQYIIDRKNGSPTNESVLNVYSQLLYGKGIRIVGQTDIYEELVEVFPKREQRKCLDDYKIFGMYAMQILRAKGGGVAMIKHLPVNKIGFEKMDSNGDINNVYYCEDWSNTIKYKPEMYPIFKGKMSESVMVKVVAPYTAGKYYYSDPDYLAALQYCQIEEEISNFSINHILNGLSFGYIININNGGSLTTEEKDKLERVIKQKLTGSSNAGKFILSFNDGKDAEVTIYPLEVNDAHNQWESLRNEARQQILTCHGVTSPLLFGLATATGFSSNADELDTASKLLQDYQITPKQERFIDELANILELAGLETDLEFIPLRDTYKSTEETQNEVEDNTIDQEDDTKNVNDAEVKMASHEIALSLIELGEDLSDEWEIIDDRRCDEITIREEQLNTVFQFAQVPVTPRKNSEQDTSLFKIRYKYAGNPTPEREFCKKVMDANKFYRAEDLNFKANYNEDFAPSGDDSYNIFKYKGGVNCKHFWQRVIFLKKDNKRISVNQARKMILELEPEDRKDARWTENEKEVAQIAERKNNFWSLIPNYRNSGVNPKKN